MLKNILYLLIFLVCISCANDKKSTVFNFDEDLIFILTENDAEIKAIDTITCFKEKQCAIEDAKNGNFIYHEFIGLGMKPRSYEEAVALFKKFNIESEEIFVSCIRFSGESENYCYGEKMNELIKKTYGSHFLDSIKKEAEKIFIQKTSKEY